MEDEGSDYVSWKVLGVVAVVAFGLVLGVVYIEYIQPESGINNGQVDQSTAEEGKVKEEEDQSDQTEIDATNEQHNQPPTAKFNPTPSSGNAPLEVAFDASSSFDEDGEVTNYDWDFGDGNTGSGETTTHTYESSGVYRVKLIVIDDEEATNWSSGMIEVSPESTEVPDYGENGEEPLSTYDIVQKKDISVEYDGEMAKRMKYSIVVGTEVEREQIKPTVREIISNIREEDEELDSIHLFLYTTESRVGDAYDVAMADWAPNGKVSNLTGRIVSENIRDNYEVKVEIKENLEEYLRKIKEQDIRFGLTVKERKDVFQEIVRCEDRGDVESSKYYDPMCSGCSEFREEDWQAKGNMSDEIIRSCKREVRNKHGIAKVQLQKISTEGMEKRWPIPDPLPFADCCDY